jgi:GTP-binding protein HflX
LAALERLYRRRIPASAVLSSEVAKVLAQFTHDIKRPIGLLVTRRGTIEDVLVGTGAEPSPSVLAKFRVGSRSLRGLRLIRSQLQDQPLSQEDLTILALLRLDLVGALSVTERGEPDQLSLAHLLPPNPEGQLCTVMKPVPLHRNSIDFSSFVQELESDLQRHTRVHTVFRGEQTAILVSASPASRLEQEERLEELKDLAVSAGIHVIDRAVQRVQDGHHRFLIGSGKLKEVLMRALQKGVELLIFDQELSPAQARAIADITELKIIDRTQLILDIFAQRAHSREGKVQVELANSATSYRVSQDMGPRCRVSAAGSEHAGREKRSWKRIGGAFATVSVIWSGNSLCLRAIRINAELGVRDTRCPSFRSSGTPMRANRRCSTS